MENNSTDQTEPVKTPEQTKSVVRETAEAFFIALLLALFIRTFIVQAFKIPSESMMKTLLVGDHILVSKFSYGIHIPNEIPLLDIKLFEDIVLFPEIPKRGDVIVFKFPKDEKKDFIKRVIGVPGDLLEIRDQKVFINNKLLNEPYIWHQEPGDSLPQRDNIAPVMIPPGMLFMMGDNRENSQDSRFWGFLDARKVKGKAQNIYWSWDTDAGRVRTERFAMSIE
jgi:signal peptidase I